MIISPCVNFPGFTEDEIVFELVEPVAMEEAQTLAKIKAYPIVWVRENVSGPQLDRL